MLGELVYCADGDGQPRRPGAVRADGAAGGGAAGGWGEAGRLKRAAGVWPGSGYAGCWFRRSFAAGNCCAGGGWGRWIQYPSSGPVPAGWPWQLLRREGIPPHQGTVALRGRRVDRDMVRAAEFLCSRVRDVAVSAPVGGGELAAWLRREFGAPSGRTAERSRQRCALTGQARWRGGGCCLCSDGARAGRDPSEGRCSGAGGQGKLP